MAKRTANNTKGKSRKKPKKRGWWGRLIRFVTLRPVRGLILILIIIVVLFWHWSAITAWANNIENKTIELFGWGLVLIDIVLAALVIALWRWQVYSVIRHWNQWLGGIAFTLAAWGVLGLFDLGGWVGRDIINFLAPELIGLLRILGLIILGSIFIAPKACFHLVKGLASWLGQQFKRRPAPPKPVPKPKALPHVVPAASEHSVMKSGKATVTSTPAVTPAPATPPTKQELRQVAQEVWKKYGESPSVVTVDGWRLPPIDILDRTPEIEFGQADNAQRARLLEEALASYGVEAKVVQINAGPTVTQFGVEPGWDRKIKEIKEKDKDGNVQVRPEEVSKTRVKVERITSLANDLALALAAHSIRLEAPVPGKSVVGIEVPNTISNLVSLRGVIETSAFQKIESKSKMCLALGKGAGGEAVAADLAKMPHLLIAGATGSGKTVCLNTIVCCLLMHNTPNDVQFIMVDPKRVELTPFNSIPHLATPVIVDTDKALSALRWLSQEMDNRYQKLASSSARNIESYNRNRQGDEKLPYLVLIIDELADLMMTGLDEVEHIICRLAQLARATGIHLVVATQRPSVDVITGLIKANFPTRISFAVTSQVDSRTILDGGGAEKLLGRGDMLYMPTEAGKPKRLQGCLVSDAEVERLVYIWGSQPKAATPSLKITELVTPAAVGKKSSAPEDSLMEAARQLLQEHGQVSASYLQRRLRIGYPRAARIMEQLEEEGEGMG
ncbi:DNA translocase FtsK, partial [Chloroflexota bacterium]